MELNLKAYIANMGMTMADFAKKIDCNPTYLSRVANNYHPAGRRLAKDVMNATNGMVKLQTKKEKESIAM